MANEDDVGWIPSGDDALHCKAVDVANQVSVPGVLQERMTVDQESAVHAEMG